MPCQLIPYCVYSPSGQLIYVLTKSVDMRQTSLAAVKEEIEKDIDELNETGEHDFGFLGLTAYSKINFRGLNAYPNDMYRKYLRDMKLPCKGIVPFGFKIQEAL